MKVHSANETSKNTSSASTSNRWANTLCGPKQLMSPIANSASGASPSTAAEKIGSGVRARARAREGSGRSPTVRGGPGAGEGPEVPGQEPHGRGRIGDGEVLAARERVAEGRHPQRGGAVAQACDDRV